MTLRPYDVKHTFGGEAFRASGNIRAVQELLGLSRLELADRYALAAIAPVAAAAAQQLAQYATRQAKALPAKVTPARKARKTA